MSLLKNIFIYIFLQGRIGQYFTTLQQVPLMIKKIKNEALYYS